MEPWLDRHIERRQREISLEKERVHRELALAEVIAVMPCIAYMVTASAFAIPIPKEE